MLLSLTTAGEALIASTPGVPPVLDSYELGTGFGYTPSTADTGLHGVSVHSGVPSLGVIQSNSLVKYTLFLDSSVGDFSFGELILKSGGVVVAVGSLGSLVSKVSTSGAINGNEIALDAYLSTIGTTYSVYAELGNSAKNGVLPVLSSVEHLPPAQDSYPNAYIVSSPDGQNSVFAFASAGQWNVTGYNEITQTSSVVSSSVTSVSLNVPATGPNYPGEILVQFVDGPNAGLVRVVDSYVSGTQSLQFNAPLPTPPLAGNLVQVIKKTVLSSDTSLILSGLDPALTSSDLNSLISYPLSSRFILRDGSLAMQAPLSLGSFVLRDLADPLLPTDAANRQYVDTAYSELMSDARDDIAMIEDVATGAANLNGTGLVPDRLGGNHKTISKLESEYQTIINAQTVQNETATASAALAGTRATAAEAARDAAIAAAANIKSGIVYLTQTNLDGQLIEATAAAGGLFPPDLTKTLFVLPVKGPRGANSPQVNLAGVATLALVEKGGGSVAPQRWLAGDTITFHRPTASSQFEIVDVNRAAKAEISALTEEIGGRYVYGNRTGLSTNNAIQITTDGGLSAASYKTTDLYVFNVTGPNTITNPTVNINGIGTKTLRTAIGGVVPLNYYKEGTHLAIRYEAGADEFRIIFMSRVDVAPTGASLVFNQSNTSGNIIVGSVTPDPVANILSLIIAHRVSYAQAEGGMAYEIAGINPGDARQLRTRSGGQISPGTWAVGDTILFRYMATGHFELITVLKDPTAIVPDTATDDSDQAFWSRSNSVIHSHASFGK